MEFQSKDFVGHTLDSLNKLKHLKFGKVSTLTSKALILILLICSFEREFLRCLTFWALCHVIWLILSPDWGDVRHFKEAFKIDADNDWQSLSYYCTFKKKQQNNQTTFGNKYRALASIKMCDFLMWRFSTPCPIFTLDKGDDRIYVHLDAEECAGMFCAGIIS